MEKLTVPSTQCTYTYLFIFIIFIIIIRTFLHLTENKKVKKFVRKQEFVSGISEHEITILPGEIDVLESWYGITYNSVL